MAGDPKKTLPKVSDRDLSLVGTFLSLAGAGGQGIYPNWFLLWIACLTIGFAGLLWTLLNSLINADGSFGKFAKKYKPYLASIILAAAVIVCARAWDRAQQLTQPPDVELVLVDPQSVNVLIVNPTDKVANQPKYMIILWNLEHPEERNPLPIPAQKNDYILSRGMWGPNQTMGMAQVKPLVNSGDRIFGYAQLSCQDCKRERTYWVCLDHGKSGWFYEIQADQLVNWHELIRQLANNPSDRERWINEQAPIAQRRAIKNSPWNMSRSD